MAKKEKYKVEQKMKEEVSTKIHVEILNNPDADIDGKKMTAKSLRKAGLNDQEIELKLLLPIEVLFSKTE